MTHHAGPSVGSRLWWRLRIVAIRSVLDLKVMRCSRLHVHERNDHEGQPQNVSGDTQTTAAPAFRRVSVP